MADAELTNQLTRINSMTNVELRAELKQRGYPTSGNKKDLLAKLHDALQKEYEQNIQQSSLNHSQNEISITDTNLPIYDQTIGQFSTVDNLQDTDPSVETEVNIPEEKIQTHCDNSTNDNNIEMKSFVSKNNEEKQKDIEKLETDKSHLPSIGSNSAKSESIIKEISLSDEPSKQSTTINEQQNSAINSKIDDIENQNDIINHSSNVNLSADLKSPITKQEEIKKVEENKLFSITNQTETNNSQLLSFMKSLNRSTNNKINLTSEILKTLIPDISLLPESIINDEFDRFLNEQSIDNNIEEIYETNNIPPSNSITIGESVDQNHSFQSKRLFNEKSNITDEPIRVKDVVVSHEPLSQILYIRGLTRPFSLFQLKELLSRYGTLIDDKFWLDKIKSQCFVTYNTLEEAQYAREALDGCRWPFTNPRILSVRFARENELEFSITHNLPPVQISTNSIGRIVQEKSHIISSPRSTSPVNEIKSTTKHNHSDVREWDMSKSQKETYSGFLIPEEEDLEKFETPVKGLDDYFRKTKAKPCIYWLPLTEEQIIERICQQEQRNVERDEAQRKREIEENTRKINSKSKHDFSLSQEKRKHSISPSRQNSKRH